MLLVGIIGENGGRKQFVRLLDIESDGVVCKDARIKRGNRYGSRIDVLDRSRKSLVLPVRNGVVGIGSSRKIDVGIGSSELSESDLHEVLVIAEGLETGDAGEIPFVLRVMIANSSWLFQANWKRVLLRLAIMVSSESM